MKLEASLSLLCCPSCSQEIVCVENPQPRVCPFCKSLYYSEAADCVRIFLENRVTRENILQQVKTRLVADRICRANSLKIRAELIFFPFWCKADFVSGVVSGSVKKSERRKRNYYIDKSYFDDAYNITVIPAFLDSGIFTHITGSIKKMLNSGISVQSFQTGVLSSRDQLFPVSIESAEAEKQSRNKKAFFISGLETRVENVEYKFFDEYDLEMTLIYYPVWQVMICTGKRMYKIYYDGHTAHSFFSDLPFSFFKRSIYSAFIGLISTLSLVVAIYILFGKSFSGINVLMTDDFFISTGIFLLNMVLFLRIIKLCFRH